MLGWIIHRLAAIVAAVGIFFTKPVKDEHNRAH